MNRDDLRPHPFLHEPLDLVGDNLKGLAQVIDPRRIVMPPRNRAVNMVGESVRVLEDLEPPRRRDEGPAQAVLVELWVQQEEFITAIITAMAKTG